MPDSVVINAQIGYQVVPIQVMVLEKEKKLMFGFRFNRQVIDEIKSLAGAKFDPDTKIWIADDCARNWVQLNYLQTKRLPWGDKFDRPIQLLPDLPENMFAHQKETVSELLQRRTLIIAHEPGLGKTYTMLEVANRVGGHWWFVCPRIAKLAWQSEIKDRYPNPNFDYTLITYNKLESLVVRGIFPDNVGFDELHKLKNPEAKRSQAAIIVADMVREKGGIVVGATGTPAPKDPSDWHFITEICQPGFLREGTKEKLKKRLGVFETVDLGYKQFSELQGWKQDEIHLLYKRLKGLVNVKFKKDCVDLPEITYKEIQLPCTDQHIAAARMLIAGEPKQALQRLRQLSDGFQYESETYGSSMETPKDEALHEIVEELTNPRVVIFAAYHKSIDKIVSKMKMLGWITIKNDGRGTVTELGKDWYDIFKDKKRDPRPIAYVGHPESGGVSLTLTAADTCIFYSNDFRGDNRTQAEQRIHRIGMGDKALVYDLLWLPCDRYVLYALKERRSLEAVSMGQLNDIFINTTDYRDTDDR